MNSYIVTNFGFVKLISFDRESQSHKIEYTDKLRYAMTFKTNAAKAFMEKHDIIGFIYNPYAEEPVRNMYEVKMDESFSWENKDCISEWKPVKALMVNESDANFLHARKLSSHNLMSLEEAQAKAIDLNTAMLKELNKKIRLQMHNALQESIDNKREE